MLLLVSVLPLLTVQAGGTSSKPLLFGAYPSADLQSSVNELVEMDTWLTNNGASGVTFAGDFVSITFNPSYNVSHELGAAWDAGFVPFVNLMTSDSSEASYYDSNCVTAVQIAGGLCDAKLGVWAAEFKKWAGTDKFAYIAPLPEMNGDWAPYSSDGATFIQAFIRIRQVFENQGVPSDAVRWVFAPNGWHNPDYSWKAFENYYPGDEYVDIISFSAYNYGNCPTTYPNWDTFDRAIKPYLDRMLTMAPTKPIFLSQTGVLESPVNPSDPTQTKSYWVEDTFSKLADYPGVRGIMYFNKINTYESVGSCTPPDYRIFYGGTNGETGFLNIMKDVRFGKYPTSDTRWDDVLVTDVIFKDILDPNLWYYDYVIKLYDNKITGGCSASPLQYCPDDSVTRAQMAVFLLKSKNGDTFTPPSGSGTKFSDVDTSYWALDWIEQLADDGITGGCGSGNYCPESPVTRAQMAVFLLKAEHGSSYTPPKATGVFSDVPIDYWAADWVEQLASEGITGGCGTGIYCPEDSVTRAQMAVFLVKTFNLP